MRPESLLKPSIKLTSTDALSSFFYLKVGPGMLIIERLYELQLILLLGTFFSTCWDFNSSYWNFFPPSRNFYLSRLYGESQAPAKPLSPL